MNSLSIFVGRNFVHHVLEIKIVAKRLCDKLFISTVYRIDKKKWKFFCDTE